MSIPETRNSLFINLKLNFSSVSSGSVSLFKGTAIIHVEILSIDDGYRKDFNMNDMHAEPPFPCGYAKSRNGCNDINGRK